MKGRNHELIAIGLAVFFVAILGFLLFYKMDVFLFLMDKIGFFWIAAGLLLFVAGSILPDADSKDRGSYVFFKKYLWFVGFFFKGLEFPLAKLLGRPRGHRKSLHTIVGISITSLFLTLVIFLFTYFFNIFKIEGIVFFFICIFSGQFLHLICDIQDGWKIKFI